MKTPREILLERHQAVAPKLKAIRREVIFAECREGRRVAVPKFRDAGMASFPRLLWRELVFPSRRIWAGLATVWLLILAVNFSLRDHSQTGALKIPSPETIMSFQQEERLLAELTGPDELHAVEPPRKFSPGPRSERIEILTT